MRLAAYEDAIYQRDHDGTLTVHRAFPLFMFGLAGEIDALTVLGRLDPMPGRSHYVVPGGACFAPLPHYENAADVAAVVGALGGTLRQFWRVLAQVDAVWVNGPSPMAVLFAALTLLRRRRLVLGVRQDTLAYARNRFPGRRGPQLAFRAMEATWRALARRASVTAVGPALARRYAGSRRLHELSVSFVRDADLEASRPPSRPGAPVRVLSVGRLETEKNPLLLADVLHELGDAFRLDIVGEGPLEADLRSRLEALGVGDRARFLGYVPLDGGLLDHYRAADVFLHVSWTEGLPQVLLEAFAARTPVVATDVGGVSAVAAGAALLVPPGEAHAAAAAVRRMVDDAELRDALVAAGLERARARTQDAERRRLIAFIAG